MVNFVLGAAGFNPSFFVILILMVAMMYFMVMRPQKKQQQKHQEMVNQMKKGDAVITIGGLHGVIDSVNTDTKIVVLDCDGVYLKFNLNAIRTVTPTAVDAAPVVEEKGATPEEETK
ncbi:preprotein translocase subunit YajC [Latilactobacillus graminis]|uniref:Preprotein translocase, YajC subunit n=2 Tax=Latilactobacillus graminis TaxID=60519 RepID=A0AA89I2S8_9LACO|nr:preprotein translocase subunit YajC [Latilactobacillus graminis]KRM24391.1 preprotein translocase, YajC subunit [Latilactobacillus graminis DSM 20719]QFP80058.1 preprotein translocase subunit YajC [Latilactobacillus graminis]